MYLVHRFDWDEDNEEHIARHGITPDEVEQVCFSQPLVRKGREGRRLVYGQTAAGRYLFIALALKDRSVARCITARPMTHGERRYYSQRRRGP
jgi:uncharacterized protein